MRWGPRTLLARAGAAAAALLVAGSVLAHGGETFMNAEPTLVMPGDDVAIRADLLTSGPVRISLAGSDGSRREVGVVDETIGGHFEVVVVIPGDVSPGVWTVLAEADGAAYGSTTIEVRANTAVADGGGQGPRDEDDTLLVPLPSGWVAVRSSPPGVVSPSTRAETLDIVPLASLVLGVAALTVLVTRTWRRGGGG